MTGISTTRAVERCERLATLGPPPAWSHPWKLKRWLKAYRAVMALDISVAAQMLREVYTPESVTAMAAAPGTMPLVKSKATGGRRFVDPLEVNEHIKELAEMPNNTLRSFTRNAVEDQALGRALTADEVAAQHGKRGGQR